MRIADGPRALCLMLLLAAGACAEAKHEDPSPVAAEIFARGAARNDTRNSVTRRAQAAKGRARAKGVRKQPNGRGRADQKSTKEPKSTAPQQSIPPPGAAGQTLVVRVQVTQPYIDKVATRVTYNGLDHEFRIDWRIDRPGGAVSGTLVVAESSVVEDRVVADILDQTNAGISAPSLYTPLTAPRLFPYLLQVREKWSREFDEALYASAGIAAVAAVLTLRPTTAPMTTQAAGSAATTRGRIATGKPDSATSTSSTAGKSTKPASKAVNLPAWKEIKIDMDHIASGHMRGGSRVSPLKDLFPEQMGRTQVERAIRQAYRFGDKVKSQGERVLMRGRYNGLTIEMWVNRATKTIETAYPVRVKE